MSTNPEEVQASESGKFGLVKLALLSLLTGAAIGLVIGYFRVALEHMNTARTDTITRAHQWPVPGFVLVCATTEVQGFLKLADGVVPSTTQVGSSVNLFKLPECTVVSY